MDEKLEVYDPCADCPFVPCFCPRRGTLADCCGGYVCPEGSCPCSADLED